MKEENLTLLILAAGMGSRFGGLKQVEPMGPNGEFIIDYSIYDAKEAGFNKVVFIIKRENYDIFKETIGSRIEDKIKVQYVFQDINDVPENVSVPSSRVKPWGTAHAIFAARDVIKEPFAIINADDFYGRDAYMKIADFLRKKQRSTKFETFGMVAYNMENTITENGSVKRGICEVEKGYVTNIIESKVEEINNEFLASPLDGREAFGIERNTPVSMNMFGFTPKLFEFIDEERTKFFEENKNDLSSCEFLIPDVIFENIKRKRCKVKSINTDSVWHGVTYKEDKKDVVASIKKMVNDGIYPNDLWK